MAKSKVSFSCSECGWQTPKWVGQCRQCGAWGSISEDASPTSRSQVAVPSVPAVPIGSVDARAATRRSTGVGELDRVLGGGIVPGAVVLLAGEPGVGKSTLLLDVAAKAAKFARDFGAGPVLYLTGEESASQVRLRATRIGALDDALLLAAENDLGRALGHIAQHEPSLVVADSVQTFADSSVEGAPGGVAQVRQVAASFIAVAKTHNIPVLLVGHVTKDGGIAGPRVLEHLVDVVCNFEGDRHARLRLLRAVKNRYGPTDEVGCFELNDHGIVGLADPSGLFLSQSEGGVPGTCITVSLEGRRPMPTEVQALVATNSLGGSPRRTTSGVDYSRTAMILAVCAARLGLDFGSRDVYVATVGGAKTSEPAVDLPVALAIISAAADRSIRPGLVAFGEVSLTGELRATVGLARRLSEAARLGFEVALVPHQGAEDVRAPQGITLLPVRNLTEAARAALVANTEAGSP
ncbi:MAG: DNA repair protein RadA [Actinomycetaceae bacterium]|nr:DNA repair protein RadA [Actinomycetaceae bacterium]